MHHSTSTYSLQRGLTLIEVVAGLALMGTLLAAMLSAKSNFTHQHHHAQRVLTAVQVADDLLMNHWQNIQELEDTRTGGFDQHDGLTWTATRIDDPAAADWYCKVVRVQVMDAKKDPDDPPLVSVDLLVPDPPAQPSQIETGDATDKESPGSSSQLADDSGETDYEMQPNNAPLQAGVSP